MHVTHHNQELARVCILVFGNAYAETYYPFAKPNHWNQVALAQAGRRIGRDGNSNDLYILDGKVWMWHYGLDRALNCGDYFAFMERVRSGEGVKLYE